MIRRVVFIEGQNVPEDLEVDGEDHLCRHYLGVVEGNAVATARVKPLGCQAKIQRVAVLEDLCSKGIGTDLMRFILSDLAGEFEEAVLGSQTHAIGFYARLGFEAFGPEYDDAGIPHRDMRRTL
ncbi:putative GNAT family N-acyltransferase [Litoreibacter ponti]|uniref:Putative GNAT family N-acyltransferase n=2 Tax=Litoreibacter ponti TaxID=1510457 RepID=A0A2T6BP55_9RHOB|nr:putative GNAT family N-acyltransferase [Litoreibacter ponti]